MQARDYGHLVQRLACPVYPICPAFSSDGTFDPKTTQAYVEYLIAHGAKAVMVTAGTSRLNLMSEREIKHLNEVAVAGANSQAVTIVANPPWGPTDLACAFAQHAESIGADVLLVCYPERYYDDQSVVAYFERIAAASQVALMLHAVPMRAAKAGGPAAAPFGVRLTEKLARVPSFVGMKEEHGSEDLRYELASRFGGELALVVAGASMRMYAGAAPFGVTSFLAGVGSLRPEIEEEFYRLHRSGAVADAVSLIWRYEQPFFDVAKPLGWHVAMKAALDLLDLMPAHERAPLQPLPVEGRQALADVLSDFGWL